MEAFSPIGNYSQSETVRILEAENKSEVERLIPLIVYIAVVSVTGIIGNGLVCYIYHPQCNTSSTRWFIFFLAVVDLVLCVIVIPIEIVTTFQQFNFANVIWCKFTAFLNLWTMLSLGLILVIIAIDRYRKVCTPYGWQMNNFKSKVMSGVVIGMSFIISVPGVFVYKIHNIRLPKHDIDGSECSFKKEMDGFSFKFIYIGFGMLLFVCSLLTICVLYCCIGVAIKKHINKERTSRHLSLSPSGRLPQSYQSSVDTDDTSFQTVITVEDESNENVFAINNVKPSIEKNRNRKSKSMRIKRARAKKASFSMFLISLAFVICYLPFLCLILVRNVIPDFHERMSDEWRAVYKFFLRSFFMCCAINPFIYGFSDSKFRQSCKDVRYALWRLLCCCRYRESVIVNK